MTHKNPWHRFCLFNKKGGAQKCKQATQFNSLKKSITRWEKTFMMTPCFSSKVSLLAALSVCFCGSSYSGSSPDHWQACSLDGLMKPQIIERCPAFTRSETWVSDFSHHPIWIVFKGWDHTGCKSRLLFAKIVMAIWFQAALEFFDRFLIYPIFYSNWAIFYPISTNLWHFKGLAEASYALPFA